MKHTDMLKMIRRSLNTGLNMEANITSNRNIATSSITSITSSTQTCWGIWDVALTGLQGFLHGKAKS